MNKINNNKLWVKYFTIVISIVSIFLVMAIFAWIVFAKIAKPNNSSSLPSKDFTNLQNKDTKTEEEGKVSNFLQAPEKTNFVIVGTDAGNLLTDVIILGCFDSVKKTIDLISIPRDTYTILSKEDIKTLKEAGRRPPSSGVMKMNAVHSYAGKELGIFYTKKQLETLFGISIDYYVELDLKAFRNIVDAVGGVDMEIPKGGLYYEDPEQNLRISIPAGMQHLNGKEAEGLVRYRKTYPRGDLQRIEMQQKFMGELFKQILNKETLINNAPSLLTTVLSYVKTNFGLEDAPKYLKYIGDLKAENLSMQTLPGTAKNINGGDYFIHDEEKTKILSSEIFTVTKTP